ncbi:hypothetical protein [Sphingomonas sp. MA1305]|uniref:hypothetical protein n=1 Tax=Sphingomonas sp. MA1305 TaxID=2479204 RepID=UPI0018DFE0D6|nr:hypothetical protein [Sphingomonas sp. MA1305]
MRVLKAKVVRLLFAAPRNRTARYITKVATEQPFGFRTVLVRTKGFTSTGSGAC